MFTREELEFMRGGLAAGMDKNCSCRHCEYTKRLIIKIQKMIDDKVLEPDKSENKCDMEEAYIEQYSLG